MDDVGEGAGLTADGLDAAGVAAADVVVEEGAGVDLGGRRIIKKKKRSLIIYVL